MNSTKETRYVGVIADGHTDQQIIIQLVKCLSGDSNSFEGIYLRQKLTQHMYRFMEKRRTEEDYGLTSVPAHELKKNIVRILYAAIVDFQSDIERDLKNSDLLVIHVDVERPLDVPETYFEEWAFTISKVFLSAIEQFYHQKIRSGWHWESLPLIIPLALFPSTDIIVAAAKVENSVATDFHKTAAKPLKRKIYGVDNLSVFTPEEFQEKALDYITHRACATIYRYVPESRLFFHSVSYG